ncbi:MAG: CtsR family transcriptional regulator [Syntrophomonadaceae bacterium]|nr:CtsR family transcriptional regulator [Syntrophomonadaceae bacterium]MDD3022707.1 CtsR family transcriptional regulator [Syntrophomonadaceae bacterium]
MKKSLADRIEQYIKVLIARSEENQIIIQRLELAETFCCVPSQVTYVIGTRFTEKTGYSTESRRGGKGYIRISMMDDEEISSDLSKRELIVFIDKLLAAKLLSKNEEELIKNIILHSSQNMSSDQRIQLYNSIRFALDDFIR